ncbi:MAG: hypothetical protein A2268_13485 [Candidatus Raymondbacteria bacterium RifOxyA12_full_50_37]|uniref:Glycosyl hydrolase 94 catalytic domain-containing protein n=1 Tax=Candidatus Raymondbacteria bacterium RIFOXYD12_FULL_49_13 TaxID=1817890 RepID=A0A1F7F8M1_UNCRA|nr:MAG: hypothetical protein A2268_13485 [Candidatus Raymondbacteria bacterium RifOxyA12_full_50_37]OGJ91519.1 MAG: hypothetical protein A2248_03710 [Candidatus Raymondbacteria bacterium RIFOXYA2_FULL_49_16]OGJ93069.1 MAG: hypothetical protein A2350_04810 [Candidatus Raymondbacteria bacterium RifOxyB12_full_50_8]OGJ97833.1 MAG: hypothetical protein A2453_14095 [Candidatus Raymondbacteria bacterium RIFOXYC2_FULL_50_21]OGK02120.1 MAG: hypothetical protein A2487_20955 [Candidatus Raymondbacteria b
MIKDAEYIFGLKIQDRVSKLGGYGPQGEVIYQSHPFGCPSVLVDSKGPATATFMSNGSVGFMVKLKDGMEVNVLDSHFDPVEKRERGVPSGNIWLDLSDKKQKRIVSLINPENNLNCPAQSIKIVKRGDPFRDMWYCSQFKNLWTAVRLFLVMTEAGPVLNREIYIKNTGKKPIKGLLWASYFLHGTQKFVYNKELWYDAGMPISDTDIIMTARVPYSPILQIKRLFSQCDGIKPSGATCDYAGFFGNTATSAAMPQAVLKGNFLKQGVGKKLTRFSTAAIGANRFTLSLNAGRNACVRQKLLYVADQKLMDTFKHNARYTQPAYSAMTKAFKNAANALIKSLSETNHATEKREAAGAHPNFEIALPHQKVAAHYANSVWTGVRELYENCRAHGAKLADGVELGTRDRGQDMWPMIKEDPVRVRSDLVHVFSFMYVTTEGGFGKNSPLTLVEKLHGMFPRQYPSHWFNRTKEVKNDNRPYTDSPVWLINALNMYIRETGDASILNETVKTIRLTDPEHPEISGIIGCDKEMKIVEVLFEIFACFERHANDAPLGCCQILYGDWCDPIDMFGTSEIGNPATRGKGRGVQIRLSAHVFLALVETIDTLINNDTSVLITFANRLRKNIIKAAWEDGANAGFISAIHETGYTLGSMRDRDFDRINRRDLTAQAFCLAMLNTKREYLDEIPGSNGMISKTLKTVDTLFYNKKLGLSLFTTPIANNEQAIKLAGRMGIVPSGCAENGEYHHAQAFMHLFRLGIDGQADTVWEQFKPIMSALRDESLAGPFETPCTSYVSDKEDPHFGKGMYFGLSGSTDWIIEIFHRIAGITFALHNKSIPAISIAPNLPEEMKETFILKRLVHAWTGKGYQKIPLTLTLARKGKGKKQTDRIIVINGIKLENPEVWNLTEFNKIEIAVHYFYA